MKQKPRWMKSVLEAAKTDVPPLPVGRHAAKAGTFAKTAQKAALVKG